MTADRTIIIPPPILKGMDRLSRRECQTKAIQKKVSLVAIAIVVYVLLSFLLSPSSDDMPRRRINEPNSSLRDPPLSSTNATTAPPLAWLLSFPNSGTSYTMRMVTRTSQTLVATNYQKSESSQERQLQPVLPDHPEGPFWPNPETSEYDVPTSYLLTKTHCGVRCNDCGPRRYLQDLKSFETVCARGSRLIQQVAEGDDQRHETVVVEEVQYDPHRVERAVHLIRNPFDNIVSRFHLERHRMMKRNKTNVLEQYPDSREGFRDFCQSMNEKYKMEVESSWLTDEISIMTNVPCRDDFFRYIVWHNLAFTVTDITLGIPTYVLHYEDYSSNQFNNTVSDLLKFLNLSRKNNNADESYPFREGHTYVNYFTEEERMAVREMMKTIAMDQTWEHIRHYFE